MGTHPPQVKDNNIQFHLYGEHLRCASQKRDLGVIKSETLKPNRQFAQAANKSKYNNESNKGSIH